MLFQQGVLFHIRIHLMPEDSINTHSEKPRIGFVIPVHGSVPLILKTLDSIRDQSVKPEVVVVVFDGPNDDIPSLVEAHPVEVITIQLDVASGGPATPRNIGFQRIRQLCDAVCFLDHDDIIHPEFIHASTETLQNEPDASMVAFGFLNWLHGEPLVDLESVPESPIQTTPLQLSEYLDATGGVLPSFSVLRTSNESIIRESGAIFDPNFRSNQDFECFVRILSQRPGIRCEWKAGWYRVITTSISADGSFAWSCRADACRSLSAWFADRGDRSNASSFRRGSGTANRRAARHFWVDGKRAHAIQTLLSNFLRQFNPRDLILMFSLPLGIDSKSRAMSQGDQRAKMKL